MSLLPPTLPYDEREASVDALERLGDPERAGLGVNVRPAEAEDLALAKPQGDGDRVERRRSDSVDANAVPDRLPDAAGGRTRPAAL